MATLPAGAAAPVPSATPAPASPASCRTISSRGSSARGHAGVSRPPGRRRRLAATTSSRSTTSGRSRPRSATALAAAFRFDTVDDTEIAPVRRRPDREGAPPAVGRRAGRVGPHALPGPRCPARAPHPVHLEPGGLRGRLPVLRDRRARLHPRPRDGRDRRPGPARRPAPGDATASASRTSCSWGWASRCSTSIGSSPRSTRSTIRIGSGSARGTSPSRPRASCPGIRRLTALGPQFTLAVSLHAARDALRDVLVPLNRRWPIAEVVAAAREHAAATGPPGDLRDDDDRRDQRHRGGRPGDGRAPPRRPRPCQPDPDEPGRPHALDRVGPERRSTRSRRSSRRPASPRRSGGTAARRSAPRAASSRRSGPASRPRRPSPGVGPAWSTRAPTPCAASAATSRHRPGWRAERWPAAGPGSRSASSTPTTRTWPTRSAAAESEGADRFHIDVMDGHFVPNLTFGPKMIKGIRPRTELPLDAHLMISDPATFVDEFLEAGCDSITFHVEVDPEQIDADPRGDPGGRPGRRARGQARDAAVRPGAVPAPARHRPRDDGRARLRRPVVHARHGGGEAPRGPRVPLPQPGRRRGPRRRRRQPRDRGVRRRARRRHPRRRLRPLDQGPRHGPRDPPRPGARRRGLPVPAQRRQAADPARRDGHVRPAARSTWRGGSWRRSSAAASR